jgi:ribonucleoside-diphosphate reductase alpha chain
LPERRKGDTHKFTIGGVSGLLTCNCYPDTGKLGEIIIKVYKSGQSMSAMMDQTAILISTMLQYGIPVEVAVSKLKNIKYEPQGFTSNKKIVTAQSISDYIAKYLELEFINNHKNKHTGGDPTIDVEDTPLQTNDFITNIRTLANNQEARTGEPCPVCGAELIQSGTCKTCSNCFITTGCG